MSVEFVGQIPETRPGERATYMTPEVLEALDARPGEWALLPTNGSQGAQSSVRQWCARNDGYEMKARGKAGDFKVYVRRVEAAA